LPLTGHRFAAYKPQTACHGAAAAAAQVSGRGAMHVLMLVMVTVLQLAGTKLQLLMPFSILHA
jgi:hypothetical protein